MGAISSVTSSAFSSLQQNLSTALNQYSKRILVISAVALAAFALYQLISSLNYGFSPSSSFYIPPSRPYISPYMVDQSIDHKQQLREIEQRIEESKDELAFERGVQFSLEQKVRDLKDVIDNKKRADPKADVEDLELSLIEKGVALDDQKELVSEKEEILFLMLDKDYPEKMRKFLESQFAAGAGFGFKRDDHEIFENLATLSGWMEKYADREEFIYNCLKEMDLFLTHIFFYSKMEACFPEELKKDLIAFHEFISLANRYFTVIEKRDPELAMNLKVKIANLPLRDDIKRSSFENVFLDECQQAEVLANHFQSEEDKQTDLVIQYIQEEQLTDKDVKRLSKFVVEKSSYLKDDNIDKLRDALKTQFGSEPADWKDQTEVEKWLKGCAHPIRARVHDARTLSWIHPGYDPEIEIIATVVKLHRIGKAKEFFEKQIGLKEEEIQIPRWYHATSYDNLDPIIKSGVIKRLHKQAFSGAWFSNQREHDMGRDAHYDLTRSSVFVFNSRITDLDPDVFIGFEKGQVRWRGIQTEDVPLKGKLAVPNLAIMGIYKGCGQKEREAVAKELTKQKMNTQIVSVAHIDYMQKEVLKVLGNPNLSESWWGKADIDSLDGPLAQT